MIQKELALGAYTIKDRNGDLIMAFSIPILCKNNNMAEAFVIVFGGNWRIKHGYAIFALELNSLLIINMLIAKKTTKHKLQQVIQRTVKMMEQSNVHIPRIFREEI